MKPIQKHQAHSHHSGPVAAMIHRISAAMGRPMSAPTSRPLSASATHRRQVILLKPKRSSTTKVWYSDSGRSIRPLMAAKAVSSANCCHIPPPRALSRA
ncbi:hypothetical protein D3C72_1966740 [compost metagenome]